MRTRSIESTLTVTVVTDGGQRWNVAPSLLRRVQDSRPAGSRRFQRDRSSEFVKSMRLSNYAVERTGARVARSGRSPLR
jgi:hypothetical protein